MEPIDQLSLIVKQDTNVSSETVQNGWGILPPEFHLFVLLLFHSVTTIKSVMFFL